MTDKKLGILAAIAALMLVITIIMYSTEEKSSTDVKLGTLLVQGLDPALINAIIIKSDKGTTTLKRTEEGDFLIEERGGYKASIQKINELIKNISDIRRGEYITASAENHAELGVAGGSKDSVTVDFLDNNGKVIVGIIKGNSAPTISGSYVRLAGEDKVFTSEDYLTINTLPTDYIKLNLFDIDKEDIKEVNVESEGTKPYTIKLENGEIVLQDIPEGKRPKGKEYEQVFRALASFYIEDVKPVGEVDVKWDTTFKCKVKGDLTYIVNLGKVEEKFYVKVAASVPPMKKVTVEEVKNASEEDTKKKDEMFQAADKAAEFNPRHNGWVYEINKWDAGSISKKFVSLVEDIPAPDEPEEISASHILLKFKEADKTATRTKEEAKALAEEILKKAKEKDADFAALAKEYSDGPTGKNGGDLGSFKRGKMVGPFEDAAFNLKVGEISGIVESDFGFHIIKRTK